VKKPLTLDKDDVDYDSITTEDTIEFTGYPSDFIFEWDFGDGNTAIGRKVSHQYLSPGFYTIICYATDPKTNTTTPTTKTLYVKDTTTPDFNGLESAIPDNHSVHLKWSPAIDTNPLIQYYIYMRKENESYNYSQPYLITQNTKCTITNLDIDTTYYFIVRARDSNGNMDNNAIELSATPFDYAPPEFKGLRSVAPISNIPGAVFLEWNPAADPSTPIIYNIYVSTIPKGEDFNNPYISTDQTWVIIDDLDLENQSYYFVVRAEDNLGNEDDNTIELRIGIIPSEDRTPPIIKNVTAQPNPQINERRVNITCDIIDNIAVNQVKLNITNPDGITMNITMLNGGNSHYYYNTIYNTVGVYQYYIWVNDVNGNSNISSVYYFEVLEGYPPITIKTIGQPKYGSDDEWVTSYTEFNLTAMDNLSGVNKTFYRIWYNHSWTPWIEYNGNFTLTGEDKHYLEYYSVDNAGNIEEVHNHTHFVDDTPPLINKIINDPNCEIISEDEYCVTTDTPIDILIEEQGCCGILVNASYRINDGTWIPIQINEDGSASTSITFDEECSHTLEIYAEDCLGNSNSKTMLFHVDDSEPLIDIDIGLPQCEVIPDEEYCVNFSTPIDLSVEEQGCCDILVNASYRITNDDTGVSTGWIPMDIQGDKAFLEYYFDEECNHTIELYAEDCLGNSNNKIILFYIDDSPPITLLEEGEPFYINDSIIWVTSDTFLYFNASDYPVCGCGVNSSWYKVDNGSWNLYQGRIVILEEGKHILYYYSMDNLGNKEIIRNQTMYVDNTPPITLVNITYDRYGNIRYVTLTADDGSVDHCMVYWATRDPFGHLIWYSQPDSVTFKGDAAKEVVEFYSVDALGNQESVRRADWATPIH